jgi:DNA-binding GntR family transcriptional regulator
MASDTFQDQEFKVARVAAPLRQSVIASIRNSIAVGRFKAGERLVERDLCEMTGVSRTVVREVIRQLESEGLVTVIPNRGPVVANVTPEQAEGIYQVRSELEGLAAELFAKNASVEDQQALGNALAHLATTSEDPVEWVNTKNDFYAALIRGAGNEALGQALNLLNGRITVLRSTSQRAPGRSEQSIAELRRLVDALLARDSKAARQAAVKHVSNAASTALAILRTQSDERSRKPE